jgi:glutamate dehydrogenase/leucine dehydrogenase
MPKYLIAAGLGIATSATGFVRTRTTALMTAEEVDRALEKTVNYRAPGR